MLATILYQIASGQVLDSLIAGCPLWLLLLLIAASMAILTKSADYMIEGAVAIAIRTGLPRIVIGATILSLGTTMPEAFVSVLAAWTGNSGLALGNGVGSIICDTGLIFGLMCLVSRVPVRRFILNRTGWVQCVSATLLVVISLAVLHLNSNTPTLGRGVGVFLLILLIGYLYMTYRWSRQSGLVPEVGEESNWGTGKAALFLCLGLTGVVVGSRVLVPCAAQTAVMMGVPQDIIAATLVAFGTSLPELVTAISAVRKGHPQIMVGNVVGADVLNCLFVVGAAATARPIEVPQTFFFFHFPAMLAILYSFRMFIFINSDGWFKRWQGIWLLSIYALYIGMQYYFRLGDA